MLAVDVGNSRLKWADISEAGVQSHGVFSYDGSDFESRLDESELVSLLSDVSISCVASTDIKSRLVKWLKQNGCTQISFAETKLEQCGVVNSYATPEKMGVDRWLAMIAARSLYNADTRSSICVIDCGTAITIDVIEVNGNHMGGLIMPGYQTMVASLGLSTGNIQSAEAGQLGHELNQGLGWSTGSGVSKGCAQMIAGGVLMILENYAHLTSGLSGEGMTCVFTGGDGEWLMECCQAKLSSRKVAFAPYLVMQGLYFTSL